MALIADEQFLTAFPAMRSEFAFMKMQYMTLQGSKSVRVQEAKERLYIMHVDNKTQHLIVDVSLRL
ncbi:hypothetical protein BDW72DRAFT_186941 [Aspergillus terricola var. indicus]